MKGVSVEENKISHHEYTFKEWWLTRWNVGLVDEGRIEWAGLCS